LRAPYNTDIANSQRDFRNDGFNTSHWDNFLLCFQCHDRRAFDPVLNPPSGVTADAEWTNFFGVPQHPADTAGQALPPTAVSWESNLHMYHLMRTGAMCHECHYNVHSNAEAQNTIFGDGTGCIGGTAGCPAGLPPDVEDGIPDGVSDTHLINFAPGGPSVYTGEKRCDDLTGETGVVDVACSGANANPNPRLTGEDDPTIVKANVFEGVEGVTADKPVWYYSLTASNDPPEDPTPYPVLRCNLRCHGVVMSTCFYITDRTISRRMNNPGNELSTWCAGGKQQVAPVRVGFAPPEIKDFLAGIAKGVFERADPRPAPNTPTPGPLLGKAHLPAPR
jgi:hypothetical protein